jgi:hypothetical protein
MMKKNRLFAPFRRRSSALALFGAVVAAIGVVAAPASSADAAMPATTACSDAAFSQPFLPWADANAYELVPGGDFETGLSGWTVTGGATQVSGSEPYAATGSLGQSSLYLPAGASVTSPAVCVDAAYPLLRFFAQNDSLTSSLLVQVVYTNSALNLVAVPVGTVSLSGTWEPTAQMSTHAALGSALASGGVGEMSIRFTAIGGPSQIDDVFVDPRCK